ncbi:MAG: serine/threonine protein kinase [Planctomycetes bacterium]|nr:serine/threonine protein kinase [Planctomycetota bacterium]
MSDASASNISMEDPADAVEALWARPGDAPDLGAFLADHPNWSPSELRAALLIDQHFRSRTSLPWSTEEYLALVPTLEADDDLTLDLIFSEVRGRSREGNAPNLEELAGRFPHLQERMGRQLEIASWFEDASGSDLQPVDEDSGRESDAAATRFGDYELHEEIARGGMCVIYRARHRNLKRIVALKMIRPERLTRAADLQRFKNETRIIAQLNHPNIISILHVDQVDGIHFFTMHMVEGRDLESLRTAYLDDVRLAARLVSSVAAAIHYAHQHGVLHRDLKPSNVLISDSGVPFVVDFGLASRLSEPRGLKPSDEFCGTPAYAAPELLQEHSHPASVAADVYGLGAILYVLITGQPPFAGSNAFEVWNKIRESQPQLPRSLNTRVDSDLEAICMKALEKNPASRYASAAVFAKDLDRYLAGNPVAARPIGWWQRGARWLRNHPVGPALALTAVILLAVIAVQSVSLHEQVKHTDAARQEAESYRRALETAKENVEHFQPDAAANQSPSEKPSEQR